MANYKLDTDSRVCFYEQEFYVLSNFSSFRLKWKGEDFDTSEAAYHWEKFPDNYIVRERILNAASAHDAYAVAQENKALRRPDWDDVKVAIMKDILREKANQHPYVKKKLLETGDRELVEDSWRDSFWGWGPDQKGRNVLGKLWMEVRKEMLDQRQQMMP
ncbi:MAG: NADAR family protein [Betaproteobacteria bacterium]